MTATVHAFTSRKKTASIVQVTQELDDIIKSLPSRDLTHDSERIYVGNLVPALFTTVSSWYNSIETLSDKTWALFKERYAGRLTAVTLYRYYLPQHGGGTLPHFTPDGERGVHYYYEGCTMCRQDLILLDGKPFAAVAFIGYDMMHSEEPDWSIAPSSYESLQDVLNVKALPLQQDSVRELLALMKQAQTGKADNRINSLFEGLVQPETVDDVLPGECCFKPISGYLCAVTDPEKIQNYERFARRHSAHIVFSKDDVEPVRGFVGWTHVETADEVAGEDGLPFSDEEDTLLLAGLYVTERGIVQVPPDQVIYSLSGKPSQEALQAAAQVVFAPNSWSIYNKAELTEIVLATDPQPWYGVDIKQHFEGFTSYSMTGLMFRTRQDAARFVKVHAGSVTGEFSIEAVTGYGLVRPLDENAPILDGRFVPVDETANAR